MSSPVSPQPRPILLLLSLMMLRGSSKLIDPPDTSLATFPVAYYGASWHRSEQNLELLSRMQVVILMQEDGPCWAKCCPNAGKIPGGHGQCGFVLTPGNDSTKYKGCDSTCDQLGTQLATFSRLKDLARAAGRRPPHCIVYLNSVYLWPFDADARYNDVKLLDIHGRPHAENCDPGIFPSFFWDWSQPTGRAAWMATVNRTVINGDADGAYVDCFEQAPLRCNKSTGVCIAKRNGSWKSINERVTPAQVAAYKVGKQTGLHIAANWVMDSGGSWDGTVGKNLNRIGIGKKPSTFLPLLPSYRARWRYILIQCPGGRFNNPLRAENLSSPVQCNTMCIAEFLLAVEPGMFLICGGIEIPEFSFPLGQAQPATFNNATGIWTRQFPTGTSVTFNETDSSGNVTWGVTQRSIAFKSDDEGLFSVVVTRK